MADGQQKSLPAIIAILAAMISYATSCSGHWIAGLILAIIAVPAGLVGLVLAASPRVAGGILSIIAIVLGGLGVVVSLLAMAGKLVRWSISG